MTRNRICREAVQQAEDEIKLESYLSREADELDFYWWWESHLHEPEISAALDEAERIAKLAEQNRIEGQLDLFGGN